MVQEKYKNRAQELCGIMKDMSGIDPMENTRRRDVVTARMMVAIVLLNEGCTTMDAAELLQKNHSSISLYKERIKLLDVPGYKAEKELWEKFKKVI